MQFDGSTGRLKSLANLDVGLTVAMQQGFAYYRAFWGNNTQPRFQASGAYVFRPNGSQTVNMADSVKVSYIKVGVTAVGACARVLACACVCVCINSFTRTLISLFMCLRLLWRSRSELN